MADHDDFEKGIAAGEVESTDEGKGPVADEKESAVPSATRTPALIAPEFIRNWTPEQRLEAETRLKRKIDLRLMPMIILSRFSFASYLPEWLEYLSYLGHPWSPFVSEEC
jgi:hypothetical protein